MSAHVSNQSRIRGSLPLLLPVLLGIGGIFFSIFVCLSILFYVCHSPRPAILLGHGCVTPHA